MSLQEKEIFVPKAIDLSHHLSDISKARDVSPLKSLQKYFTNPEIIQLAGGLPDPAYFPFASISADALDPLSFVNSSSGGSSMFEWLWNIFGSSEKTAQFSVPKYALQKGDMDLATSLQYGPATGTVTLSKFIKEFSEMAYTPAYSDWQTLAQCGNTDGFNRAVRMLCNPGEYVLTEEWTYPSVLACIKPLGNKAVGVKVDAQGMSATDLESILNTWDENGRGAKRPHVMYTVPIGQNPTGATMGEERKKAIYSICARYDIVIIEDDPYYFLQEGTYVPKELRKKQKPSTVHKGEDEAIAFLRSLVPSYLKFDYQGRVIRLDSFSKIIAPGSRMGWFTCNPLFAERLERDGETETQAPCGFSQALIMQLVTKHWGVPNFIRWLQGLRAQYTTRRDFFIDCIFDVFDVMPATPEMAAFGAGSPVMTAYPKLARGQMSEKSLLRRGAASFSFIPPSSGMFIWIKFHVKNVIPDEGQSVGLKLFIDLAENGVLIAPGEIFSAEGRATEEAVFRISFSKGTEETLKRGVKIIEKTLRQYLVN